MEEEFDSLNVYLNLFGDLVENQEDDKISHLEITRTHNGAPYCTYDQIEKLGLFRGSEDVLLIDSGYGVYTEIIHSGLKFEIKEYEA